MCDVCGCNRKVKVPTALKGDTGVGVDDITSAVVGANTVITFTMTDGTVYTVSIANPEDGVDSNSIDHISFTSTTDGGGLAGVAGATDTYTFWGDVGETVNLGTFDVTNGPGAVGEINNGESLATVDAIDIYQGMSGTDLTFLGIDVGDGLAISEDGADILIELDEGTFTLVDPAGTTPGANPVYVSSPTPFSSVNDYPSLHRVGFQKDPTSKKVDLKGSFQLQGYTFGIDPTAAVVLTSARIITNIPVSMRPAANTLIKVNMLNVSAKFVGTAVVNVLTTGEMLLYLDSRFHYVHTGGGTILSFEGSSYSLE